MLNPGYTFQTFIKGKSNSAALRAAWRVVEAPSTACNPLLIYGSSGLGKTHLMHAVGNAIAARDPHARITCLSTEQWMNHFIAAIRHGRGEELTSLYCSVGALLIDDVDLFAHKARTQDEFLHTLELLVDMRRQIVLTAGRDTRMVGGLGERLKSRFTRGLAVAVDVPALGTRVAILTAKAKAEHVRLPKEVALFVAQSVRSNVRELEGALLSLSVSSRLSGEALTVDFARSMLNER